jgi:hypothetical protein
MDRGQHGPPRREVWSWYHPSSKSILPSRQPAAQFIDNLKLSLLTRSSRFFQGMYYCKRTVSIEPTTLVAGKGGNLRVLQPSVSEGPTYRLVLPPLRGSLGAIFVAAFIPRGGRPGERELRSPFPEPSLPVV